MTQNLDLLLTDPAIWRLIRSHPIFNEMSDEEVRQILPFFTFVNLLPREFLIEEGQDSMDLYLVLSGSLDVFKKADNGDGSSFTSVNQQFVIASLASGDTIGELSFIKGTLRSASVQSTTKSTLIGIKPADLTRLEQVFPHVAARMMKNILSYVGNRLIKTSANQVSALKVELENSIRNSKANLFFSYVIGLLCVYNLTIHTITTLSIDTNRASVISAIIIIVFCGVLLLMIRQTRLPIRIFGLTTKNWLPALKESGVWTVLVIGLIAGIKWTLIQTVPRYQHLSLIDFDVTNQQLLFSFLIYGLHSPVQEFIARGVLQGSLQHFFTGKNVVLRAVIVSNALFSATHVHLMSGLLGVIVFVPGLLWGWLYSRHENLIGVSVSHLLIGWSALFFFNLQSLF